MKNLFSTAVLATALALLVPNNGAEAVGTDPMQPVSAASVSSVEPTTSSFASNLSTNNPDPKLAWIVSLGFLGFVITRRLRGD